MACGLAQLVIVGERADLLALREQAEKFETLIRPDVTTISLEYYQADHNPNWKTAGSSVQICYADWN